MLSHHSRTGSEVPHDKFASRCNTAYMCFKNLPIEFNPSGQAKLREGLAAPWAVQTTARKGYVRRRSGPGAQLAAPPRLREWSIDPMTRVAGALAIHTVLDLENRKAV